MRRKGRRRRKLLVYLLVFSAFFVLPATDVAPWYLTQRRYHPVCCFSCAAKGRLVRWYIIMCTTTIPALYCRTCTAFFPAIAPPDDWLPREAWPGLDRVLTEWMRLYIRPPRAPA